MAKPKTKEEQAKQEARLKKMGTLVNIETGTVFDIHKIKESEIVIKEVQTIAVTTFKEGGGKKNAQLRRSNTNKQKDTGARS